jgi:hypothetical protein
MDRPQHKAKRPSASPVLGFIAGALFIGIPLSIIATEFVIDSVVVWIGVMIGCALLGAIFGDSFFESAADSRWWAAVRGFFRHWWL